MFFCKERRKCDEESRKSGLRALFTSSEGKNERGKNAGYGAEMGIFYPHSSRESKKNIQKENGKVDEFQNILRENAG